MKLSTLFSIQDIARSLIPLAIFISIWQVTAYLVTTIRDVPFPDPLSTFDQFAALLGGRPISAHSLYRHIFDSLTRWMIGFGIASAVGVGYGLAAGWYRPLHDSTTPLVYLLQLIPGLAWIPVAILIFGIGEAATVFMIGMTAFPPIAINVLNGVKRLDTTYFRAAQMMGADRKTLFLRVLLPGALPSIISGLRIGLGNGWRVLVAAEMIVGTGTGLGYSIIQSRWTLDYPSAFACVGVICLIGLLFEKLVFEPLEKHTVERWALDRKE
ncbi:MAG: ABC transporter permease [Desulfobacterales bacterium]